MGFSELLALLLLVVILGLLMRYGASGRTAALGLMLTGLVVLMVVLALAVRLAALGLLLIIAGALTFLLLGVRMRHKPDG